MAPKFGGAKAPGYVDVLHARGAGGATRSGVQRTPPIRSPWPTILLITVAGVGGFVGLLVCSHYFPAIADPLRFAALVWFFAFGLIQSTFLGRQR
jgi:hypothetical protein